MLTIQGRVEIGEVERILLDSPRRLIGTWGDEAARAYLAEIAQSGTPMARIDLRPSRLGVLDCQSQLPSALGGIS